MSKLETDLDVERRAVLRILAIAAAAGSLSNIRTFAQARAGGGTRLILLGTQAGPNIELTRNEMASLLVAGGQPYLVDCGYGALRGRVQAGLNYRDVSHVFLTHLHDDHTSDLSALLSHQWNQWPRGRTLPTTIHGPHGTSRWLEGFLSSPKPTRQSVWRTKGDLTARRRVSDRSPGSFRMIWSGRMTSSPRI